MRTLGGYKYNILSPKGDNTMFTLLSLAFPRRLETVKNGIDKLPCHVQAKFPRSQRKQVLTN